jgi:hypothetical protein
MKHLRDMGLEIKPNAQGWIDWPQSEQVAAPFAKPAPTSGYDTSRPAEVSGED